METAMVDEAMRELDRVIHRLSKEDLLAALSIPPPSKDLAIGIGTLRGHEIEAEIVALVERAVREPLGESENWLAFRGIHILGGRRLTRVHAP